MARFVFGLQRVLKHKEQRERIAEMRQLQALARLRQDEAAAAALRVRIEQAISEAKPTGGGGWSLAVWLAQRRHIERLTQELAGAETQVRAAARRLHEASAARRQQAREAEALRQLRHRQHDTYLKQAAKAEQRFLDEQGLRGWRLADGGAVEDEGARP